VTASDDAGNSAERAITVKVTTPPGAAAENTWWWTASGLLLALGIMIPLTALLVTMSLRMRRRSMEGSK